MQCGLNAGPVMVLASSLLLPLGRTGIIDEFTALVKILSNRVYKIIKGQ